jgi:hypothetical protein
LEFGDSTHGFEKLDEENGRKIDVAEKVRVISDLAWINSDRTCLSSVEEYHPLPDPSTLKTKSSCTRITKVVEVGK